MTYPDDDDNDYLDEPFLDPFDRGDLLNERDSTTADAFDREGEGADYLDHEADPDAPPSKPEPREDEQGDEDLLPPPYNRPPDER